MACSRHSIFAVKAHRVGNKAYSGLGITIPTELVRLLGLSLNAVFVLHVDKDERRIAVRVLDTNENHTGAIT